MSEPAYERAWAAYRGAARFLRLTDEVWLVPIGVFAVGIVALELIPNQLDWRGPLWWLFLLLMAASLVVRVVAHRRVRRFRCPRCGEPFVRREAPLAAIERRLPCQNCGLPVGAATP